MIKPTYSELLRDPRWQRKRLQILDRDKWQCQHCRDSGSTLHVHHIIYEKGRDPWEYNDSNFLTLCKDCHTKEEQIRKRWMALGQSISSKTKLEMLNILERKYPKTEQPSLDYVFSLVVFLLNNRSILMGFGNIASDPSNILNDLGYTEGELNQLKPRIIGLIEDGSIVFHDGDAVLGEIHEMELTQMLLREHEKLVFEILKDWETKK